MTKGLMIAYIVAVVILFLPVLVMELQIRQLKKLKEQLIKAGERYGKDPR